MATGGAAERAKVLRLLGLARRASALRLGADAAAQSLRRGEARLLFLAADAGRATRARFVRLAEEAAVPLVECFAGAELAEAAGRFPLSVLSLGGEGFALEIVRLLGPAAAAGGGGAAQGPEKA